MLLLGIYIGGVIVAAFSYVGAAMDKDGPYGWGKEFPNLGQILFALIVVAMCLLWPATMIWMIVDTYLKNR